MAIEMRSMVGGVARRTEANKRDFDLDESGA